MAEHAAHLRTLLTRALARDLDEAGGNLLTLSGGVDSSSLLALASGVVGRPVWTWSLLPGPEHLLEREMRYIAPLIEQFGVERTWSHRIWDWADWPEMLRQAPDVVFHVTHPALCALPALVHDAPVRVLFGGEFADQICGGGGTTPDWAAHTSFIDLITRPRQLPSGSMDLLRWAKHWVLERRGTPRMPFPSGLPAFVRTDVKDEYREWYALRRQLAAEDREDRRYLALLTDISGWVPMNWEAASALGVRRSFPFFHREMLELAFECHPSELVGPGHKKLLRASLHADVPPRNLGRTDKGGWGRGLPAGLPLKAPKLAGTLADIVDPAWMQTLPKTARLSDVRGLVQLQVFVEAVAARRRARTRLNQEGAHDGRQLKPSDVASATQPPAGKKPYVPPKLTKYGNVAALTAGTMTDKGDDMGTSAP